MSRYMKEVTEGAIGKSLPGLIIVPSNFLRVDTVILFHRWGFRHREVK